MSKKTYSVGVTISEDGGEYLLYSDEISCDATPCSLMMEFGGLIESVKAPVEKIRYDARMCAAYVNVRESVNRHASIYETITCRYAPSVLMIEFRKLVAEMKARYSPDALFVDDSDALDRERLAWWNDVVARNEWRGCCKNARGFMVPR